MTCDPFEIEIARMLRHDDADPEELARWLDRITLERPSPTAGTIGGKPRPSPDRADGPMEPFTPPAIVLEDGLPPGVILVGSPEVESDPFDEPSVVVYHPDRGYLVVYLSDTESLEALGFTPGLELLPQEQERRMMTTSDMLDAIDDEGKGVTDWEADFIDSMMKHRAAGRSFTPGQESMIQKIYRQRVSGED